MLRWSPQHANGCPSNLPLFQLLSTPSLLVVTPQFPLFLHDPSPSNRTPKTSIIMGDNFDQVSQQLSRRSPNKQDAIHQVAEENDILRCDDIECESNLSTSNISDSGSNSSSNGLDTSSKAATHWDLPPPPAESFPTYELAKSSAHEWARLHGYDFSVKKVCKNKDGKIHRRSLVCTRGGKLDNKRKLTEETRIRKRRGSKKGGCEVQIWLAADDINEPEGPWSIRHAGGTRSTWHNHPGAHKTDLPGHRQRAQKKRHVDDFIRQHRAARIKPQQSLAIIQQQMPDLPIVLDDVRNARSRQRREFVDTHTLDLRPDYNTSPN